MPHKTQISPAGVGCLQLAASLPPPPSANFGQLAKTPASSRLLNEFLLHEKQRISLLAGELGGAPASAPASASVPSAARSAPAKSGQPSLAPDQPGSLASATPTYSQALGSTAHFRLDQYHPLEEIYAYLGALARLHPKRARLFTIGHTGEQRPIKALELINNATDPDYVWLDALTHAREWITGTTILYTIDRLLAATSAPGQAPAVFAKNYIIIPVVNPDGYAYTWSTNRMWRKNRSRSSRAAAARTPETALAGKSCVGVSRGVDGPAPVRFRLRLRPAVR